MPASCAKALRPTIALFGCGQTPVSGRELRARRREQLGADAGLEAEHLAAHLERHHDLLERGVAGALADAVDRALDLARPGLHGGERVRDREPEVVVAVHRDDRARHVVRRAGAISSAYSWGSA